MTLSTLSSINYSASLINEVCDPLPPSCKLDLGLSARNFLFCVARFRTRGSEAVAGHRPILE
jgi:hypothetical protein